MRSISATLFAILLPLASAAAFAASQDQGNILVQSIAEVEVEVVNQAGRKEKKRAPVAQATPGSRVIYTTRFTNKGDKPAANVVINNPIPENTVYIGGSAFGASTSIAYSVNGGKHYDTPDKLKLKTADGRERQAAPGDYTHIRWRYLGDLAPGKRGEVGFHVLIK